jgi:hypothetical protein
MTCKTGLRRKTGEQRAVNRYGKLADEMKRMAEMVYDPVLKQHLSAQATRFSTQATPPEMVMTRLKVGERVPSTPSSNAASQPKHVEPPMKSASSPTGPQKPDVIALVVLPPIQIRDKSTPVATPATASVPPGPVPAVASVAPTTPALAPPRAKSATPTAPMSATPADVIVVESLLTAKKELPRRGTRRGSFDVDAGQAGKM